MLSSQAGTFRVRFSSTFKKKGDISCTFMAWSKFLLTPLGVRWNPRELKVASRGTPLTELVGDRGSSRKAGRESLMPQKLWQVHQVGSPQPFSAAGSSHRMKTEKFPLDLTTWWLIDVMGQEPDGCGLRSPWGTRMCVPSQP